MTPAFRPPPMPYPAPPIYLGDVDTQVTLIAGEMDNGFSVHPFHSSRYLREVVLPNLAYGASKAGSSVADVTSCSSAFCVTGATAEEMETAHETVRQQLSFHASTKAYRVVL